MTKNTRHTPGPWKAGSASVSAPETEDRLGLSVRIHGGNGADNRANARLIAAAPDLLAALEALLPMVAEWHAEFPRHIGDKEPPAIQAARAAIAKATGFEPGTRPPTPDLDRA